MNCSTARPHLAALADAEVSTPLADELQEHLRACADCRVQVALWRSVRQSARRAVTNSVVPSGIRERVRRRLAQRRRASRTLLLLGNTVVATAAVLLLAIISWRYLDPDWLGRQQAPAPLPAALRVAPTALADVFASCAHPRPHDVLARGRPHRQVLEDLARTAGFEVLLPDLSGAGFQLVGVCTCCRIPGFREVNAVYTSGPVVVLLASLDGRVSVGDEEVPDCGPRVRRRYERVTTDDLSIVKWNHGTGSYAALARLPTAELVALTDRTDFDFGPGTCTGGLARAVP